LTALRRTRRSSGGLGVLDEHIEVAVLGEHAVSISSYSSSCRLRAPVDLDQLRVGKAACGYL